MFSMMSKYEKTHFFVRYSCVDSDRDCSDKTVLWSRSDFTKIVESFRLPKRFTQMMGRCHCLFAQSPPDRIDAGAEQFCKSV
jgi:hypothetical protein